MKQTHLNSGMGGRATKALALALLLALSFAACADDPAPVTPTPAPPPPAPTPTPEPEPPAPMVEDSEVAMRWWNALNAAQMAAAIYGDMPTEEQRAAAGRPYAELEGETKQLVNDAAASIYSMAPYDSVGQWWETLNCQLMRVAAGDGNTADPESPFCAHYPGSGAARILDAASKEFVDVVGKALLGREDIGVFPPDSVAAMRWWDVLDADQMTAAIYGNMATEAQREAAARPYAMLEGETKRLVNEAAAMIYGEGNYESVGEWWETLDCQFMRVAAGDGNTADPASPFCAHYPGSGLAKILDTMSKEWVDVVGKALLDLEDIGVFAADSEVAMRWWDVLDADQMTAAIYGNMATAEQRAAAARPYAELESKTKRLVNEAADAIYGEGGYDSVGEWWETLDCRLMRIAAGDGNTADPASPFCAHYPGSGLAKILDAMSKDWVDVVGKALLDLEDIGVFTADSEVAMRWWDVLNADQMTAAIYGNMATEEQRTAAARPYAELGGETKRLVNDAADSIYAEAPYDSVGQWWETLNCQLMRVAAGDGNTADPASPFCAHYPGSGAAKILNAMSRQWVDMVGKALLDREDIGVFPPDSAVAMRWWDVLNADQMTAAIYGNMATAMQREAASRPYAMLEGETKRLVNEAAASIYSMAPYESVGHWWETLNCAEMRVAAGDGNMADPSSAFCAHYPGSGAAKILDAMSKMWVDVVGLALLDRDEVGTFPAASEVAMRWWAELNADQMTAAIYGNMATAEQRMAASRPYAELDAETRMKVNEAAAMIYGMGDHDSVGAWWETLNCPLMRVAAGDGNTLDKKSPYCAHYPGSGFATILEPKYKMFVDQIGKAILATDDIGVYPADSELAMRWWSVLNADQMTWSIYGRQATRDQRANAARPYAKLEGETKRLVNAAAAEIYGDGGFDSVGQWWETLDCRQMRVAVGSGNTKDPASRYCAHYPGSGAAKILDTGARLRVDEVGLALLNRDDIGVFPEDSAVAMRWWDVLNADQMTAAIYGNMATAAQRAAAARPYARLEGETKKKVNDAAAEIYGDGDFDSVGRWWETLDCRKMRVAAGDGNMAGTSKFCAHYPGSGAAKILDAMSKDWVDVIGMALLDRADPGRFP